MRGSGFSRFVYQAVPVGVGRSLGPVARADLAKYVRHVAHELKHHFADRKNSTDMRLLCAPDPSEFGYGKAPVTEIAAEIFAAEFIFPEDEFLKWASARLPQSEVKPSDVVKLKQKCPAKVSYAFITKRLEWLRFTKPGQFKGVQFGRLERKIYGTPWYLKPRKYKRAK